MAAKKPLAASQKVGKGSMGGSALYYSAAAVAALAVCYFVLFSDQRERIGVCGDGLCGFDEDDRSCSKDCYGRCGDGFCSMKETCVGGPAKELKGRKECAEDCGQCTTSNLATCHAEAGMDEAHNSSMLWGTYRPHLFFGTRTRHAAPIYFSLMWHDPLDYERVRYDAGGDGIGKYGWVEHDAKHYGHQVVEDTHLGVQMNTTFVKRNHEGAKSKGGDWVVRVSGKKLKESSKKGGQVSLVFHMSTHGKKGGLNTAEVAEGGDKSSGLLATRSGRSAATGAFTTAIFYDGGGGASVHHFGMKNKEEYAAVADRIVQQIYQNSVQKAREQGVGGPVVVEMPDEHRNGDDANLGFVQVVVPTPFEIEFVFLNHQSNGLEADPNIQQVVHASLPLRGAKLTELIEQRSASFNARFDEVFSLGDKPCKPTSSSPYKRGKNDAKYPACSDEGALTEHARSLGKAALSQTLGGINYLHGTWFKSTNAPFFNNSVEQKSVVSFSGSPCRNGFARGFLWDEGFHQLLISRWEPAITRDVLLHWFNLMEPDGWIPREHFIGKP